MQDIVDLCVILGVQNGIQVRLEAVDARKIRIEDGVGD